MKRRKYITLAGGGKYKIDKYPELDKFVPDAEIEANALHDRKENRPEWDLAFLQAMNDILVSRNLRVA